MKTKILHSCRCVLWVLKKLYSGNQFLIYTWEFSRRLSLKVMDGGKTIEFIMFVIFMSLELQERPALMQHEYFWEHCKYSFPCYVLTKESIRLKL